LRVELAAGPQDEAMGTNPEAPARPGLQEVKLQLAELATRLAVVTSERDSLRMAVPAATGPVDLPSDVPALEAEVTRLQEALGSALADRDPEGYDRAAAAHARAASALARALRQKPRVA